MLPLAETLNQTYSDTMVTMSGSILALDKTVDLKAEVRIIHMTKSISNFPIFVSYQYSISMYSPAPKSISNISEVLNNFIELYGKYNI